MLKLGRLVKESNDLAYFFFMVTLFLFWNKHPPPSSTVLFFIHDSCSHNLTDPRKMFSLK
jgi:hypothetical protein